MSFLSCIPSVFVIGNRYEILINTKENGLCAIEIGGKIYHDHRAGVIVSESTLHKIAVPMSALDSAGAYTVRFRRTIEKKSYYSEFEDTVTEAFAFRPVRKEGDIHIYHLADVHCAFGLGVRCAQFFGENLDLLIVNGDIAEVNRESDFFHVAEFVGEITGGSIPVLFTRGNHDTRGKLAARLSEYFPTENGTHYYTFSLSRLCGVVFDCGEDKTDDNPAYSGGNIFEQYRREETEFLRSVQLPADKIPFAVGHICPVRTITDGNPLFDIEKEVYTEWNREFERMNIRFMLTGHTHRAEFVEKDDGTLPHAYPVIVGSASDSGKSHLVGCAITVKEDRICCAFTDPDRNVLEEKEYLL